MQLVSVILGTYNGSKYIETQLRSILEQSYTNLEILIVDDASSDETLTIVSKFALKDERIKVHEFERNVGYIKNFERGIALAKGDLIALSDQDDWWDNTKIEKLVAFIKSNDLTYCDSEFVNDKMESIGNSFSKSKHMIDSLNPLNFLIDNCVSGHAMLFKKSLFNLAKPFPPLIPHDWWLAYWASMGNGLTYYDEALIKYRHHDENVIASSSHHKTALEKKEERINRLNHFYKASKKANHSQQTLVFKFKETYRNFNIITNINRAILFYKHRDEVLKILKKSEFKKKMFSFNMFFKLK